MPRKPRSHDPIPRGVRERMKRQADERRKARGRRPGSPDAIRRTERWKRLSSWYRRKHAVCQRCQDEVSESVHHVEPLEQRPDLAFVESNLRALCSRCHAIEEKGARS